MSAKVTASPKKGKPQTPYFLQELERGLENYPGFKMIADLGPPQKRQRLEDELKTIGERITDVKEIIAELEEEFKKTQDKDTAYLNDRKQLLRAMQTGQSSFPRIIRELDRELKEASWPYPPPSAMAEKSEAEYQFSPNPLPKSRSSLAVQLSMLYDPEVPTDFPFDFCPEEKGYERVFTGALSAELDQFLFGSGFRCVHNVPVHADPNIAGDLIIVRQEFVRTAAVRPENTVTVVDCKNDSAYKACVETVWYNCMSNYNAACENEYLTLPCTRSLFILGTSIVPHHVSKREPPYFTKVAQESWGSQNVKAWLVAIKKYLLDIDTYRNRYRFPQNIPVPLRRILIGGDECIKFFEAQSKRSQDASAREAAGWKHVHGIAVQCKQTKLGDHYVLMPAYNVSESVKWTAEQLTMLFSQLMACHTNIGVHGDVRLANMLQLTNGKAILIDFELAGITRYPEGYNGELPERHNLAKENMEARREHDLYSFLQILHKVKVQQKLVGGDVDDLEKKVQGSLRELQSQ